ncbi:glutamyl-tRNA synthetase family protein [Cryptosporidium andersoni]|uniref:glutamate--tRNA ligase n=1 Tax=Cryptosporidium andersoni TaxID=117008 RepID=A0A1J4MSL8_9CRYT|nr:glutamyl-tRNA synthetase family protein [Cryptosporidium andersoni]
MSSNPVSSLCGDIKDIKIDHKEKSGNYEGKLPNAIEGEVVTRFPPEPSGYLHIGHAKAALLNFYYSQRYKGKMLLRFDDTNPALENEEFQNSIMEDLKVLNVSFYSLSFTSDYFDEIMNYCKEMIKMGKAYADNTPVEVMREERGKGIENQNRNNTVEENLKLWDEMISGSEDGLKCCIRAKIDMSCKNKCMRDPVIYRCILLPHHRTGTKYKVYPTYDFACPIVDSIEGVTHALRTNEYSDRIEQYQWVIKALDLRPVNIYEFSRLNFVHTILSKRKLSWIVNSGLVDGWDDPRFPTVRGILRRGLTPQALLKFVIEQGPSKNSNLMEWDKLWTINKQIIDPIIPRFFCVGQDAVVVNFSNGPELPVINERDLHQKNKDIGKGPITMYKSILIDRDDASLFTDNEEITLMKWSNAIVTNLNNLNSSLGKIDGKLNLQGDFRSTKKKIHWLANLPTNLVKCILREFDHLIIKKKPEDGDNIEDLVNRNSMFETHAYCDPLVKNLKLGDKLQFERRGYFIIDKPFDVNKPDKAIILIKIPDGRSKLSSNISTKVDSQKLTKGA